jgi:thymidylate synthase
LWNPSELNDQALPCCYTGFNFYKVNGKLHTVMNFRSSDIFLGLPFDIIVGAMFAHYFAQKAGLKVGTLNLSIANAHLYSEHEEAARETIKKQSTYCTAKLKAKKWGDILNPEDFKIENYKSNEFIKADLIC